MSLRGFPEARHGADERLLTGCGRGIGRRTAVRALRAAGVFLGMRSYATALRALAVALSFAARMALVPLLPDDSPYLLFVPAVLVAAASAGSGPDCWRPRSARCSAFFSSTEVPDCRLPRSSTRRSSHSLEPALPGAGNSCNATAGGPQTSTRDALAREAHLQIDSGHRARRDDRHRRARDHAIIQLGGGTAVRPHGCGGARKQRQDADAVAVPGGPRRLSRTLSADRGAADHRDRPRRRRRAQGRLDLSDGACGRRNAIGQSSAFSPASSAT